ncbi:MFS transporter [Tsukamurella sputi]|uniref:MFS transporter n=1 Tax=Tsukamurella sputi TaxID=2591848 RepID=A0A5C5RMV7_9ACTN|nr:MFS transporter [Tsukamurella sputi]TWS24010.1 MFS transporter [Tsukamurella sputi]
MIDATALPDAKTAGADEPKADQDRRILVFIGLYSAVLYTVLLIAPVIAEPLSERYGLDAAHVGVLFSCELGAFSLATVPAYVWLTRVSPVRAVTAFTMVVALGHLASGVAPSFGALVAIRIVTSLAAGSITVILLSLPRRTANPGRAFGVFVVAQLAMGALILAVFPSIYAGHGIAPLYWTLAVLTVLCLPLSRLLRGVRLTEPADGAEGVGDAAPAAGRAVARTIAGFAALFCFYVALSGVWTFMGTISTDAGNDAGATSIVLSIATAAGIASAVIATTLGESRLRGAYLVGGLACLALAVALLFGAPALARFLVAAILFKFAWTFVLPYLLSAIAALPGGGQTMNTANLMIGGGFALGPIVAGALSNDGSFAAMLAFSCATLLLALVLAVVLCAGRLVAARA